MFDPGPMVGFIFPPKPADQPHRTQKKTDRDPVGLYY